MVIQQVDKRLLSELEAMGFSEAQARKALHHSGNLSIEAAVNWIIDNENDAATDEMPMCLQDPVNIEIEEIDPRLISEEVKLCAQELRNRSRKKKAEEKKKFESEREKERIRVGKELLEAKEMAEERERKRFLAQRKAEKEEERRAREKIRQKLQQDKAERRVGLGLPREAVEGATSTIPATSLLQGTRPAEKAELLRECLRTLKRHNKEDNTVTRAFRTLLIYVRNVVKNPEEGKFRKIRISNPAFQDRVGKFRDAIKFLELCGFERVEGGNFLFLPREKIDMGVLKVAGAELQNAITNPFFGLLSR
ncbi:UBX domain-containing protein 1-like isoform X3 [Olea europaea var. sylvestris]|uniref:UBX domain-containing protein 1-like isoform X3 n=1 Tax=Olea europaea var. sylvestris TaxID=158386 RepID=UPI000C1D776C|nr:UBX domain-containing protein 1-like isoform X3 [Olea europaea var. sylvestris]